MLMSQNFPHRLVSFRTESLAGFYYYRLLVRLLSLDNSVILNRQELTCLSSLPPSHLH